MHGAEEEVHGAEEGHGAEEEVHGAEEEKHGAEEDVHSAGSRAWAHLSWATKQHCLVGPRLSALLLFPWFLLEFCVSVCTSAHSCATLCNPMDCS